MGIPTPYKRKLWIEKFIIVNYEKEVTAKCVVDAFNFFSYMLQQLVFVRFKPQTFCRILYTAQDGKSNTWEACLTA
jgi:hypothetical protein